MLVFGFGLADLFGDGAGALAGHVDQFGIRSDFVEGGEERGRFGDQFAADVVLHAENHIVHAQVIVAHDALHVAQIEFLPLEAVENGLQLLRIRIVREIERDLIFRCAIFVSERFCAEIGDAAVNVEIRSLKIVEAGGEREHFLRERGVYLQRLRTWRVIQLANIPGAFAFLIYGDLDVFGIARFENLRESQSGAAVGVVCIRRHFTGFLRAGARRRGEGHQQSERAQQNSGLPSRTSHKSPCYKDARIRKMAARSFPPAAFGRLRRNCTGGETLRGARAMRMAQRHGQRVGSIRRLGLLA